MKYVNLVLEQGEPTTEFHFNGLYGDDKLDKIRLFRKIIRIRKELCNTTATTVYIDITDVPHGSLYYIKDISRGKQNRIFIYENNRIIWY